jgi:hypothetical protein
MISTTWRHARRILLRAFFSVLFIILFYFNIAVGTRFVSLVRAVEKAIQKSTSTATVVVVVVIA